VWKPGWQFYASRSPRQKWTVKFFEPQNEGDSILGGGFKDFLFSTLPGEIIQFD